MQRDIKSPNLLLARECDATTNKFKRYRLMISDFGTATLRKKVARNARTGNTGTPEWVPPELTRGTEGLREYDSRCDVWGLGLVLHFLAYSQLPWVHTRVEERELDEEIRRGIKGFPASPLRSTEMKSMICKLMKRDPDKRPTTRDLMLSPLIKALFVSFANSEQFELHQLVIMEDSSRNPKESPYFHPTELKKLTRANNTISQPVVQFTETPPVSRWVPKRSSSKTMLESNSGTHSPYSLYTIIHLVLFSFKVALLLFSCNSSRPGTLFSWISLCLAAVILVCRHEAKVLAGLSLVELVLGITFYSSGYLCPNPKTFFPYLCILAYGVAMVINFQLNTHRKRF
eukprot:TRINITY_DN4845_c0_g1_i8.p1 TRINITY_DN4845_c0_g1~~TRINITY_DN4845_c0_g1_i8.p1  ORF type:complete len:344 (+),score=49.22 TRINITY_DN4845_c0_g1_i8:721-1752(+)